MLFIFENWAVYLEVLSEGHLDVGMMEAKAALPRFKA